MTDSGGNFEFNGMPQGQYMIAAEKPGYFFDLRRRSSIDYFVRVGPEGATTDLSLIPEATITGRCLDEDGMPIQGLQIHLASRSTHTGHVKWEPGESILTNRDGTYRIGDIVPGRYLLIAGPTATVAAMASVGSAGGAYPVTYFGGNTSGLTLSAGEHLEANFNLEAKRLFKIAGTVSGPGTKRVRVIPVEPGQQSKDAPMEGDHFHVSMVSPGAYMIHASSENEDKQYETLTTIHVDNDINDLSLKLKPQVEIPVQIRGDLPKTPSGLEEDDDEESAKTYPIQLEPLSDLQGQVLIQGGSVSIPPGRYFAKTSLDPRFYVAAARMGSTDLLSQEIEIDGGSNAPIELEIRKDGATLKVEVQGDTLPVVSAIVVVPDHGHSFTHPLEGNTTEIGQLAPGTYHLLAIHNISDLAFDDPAALEPYMSDAISVELSANQHATVKLHVVKQEEE
jgi:hypothetical protein